jgi:hypothetical protein
MSVVNVEYGKRLDGTVGKDEVNRGKKNGRVD